MRLIPDLVYFCKNVDLPLLPPPRIREGFLIGGESKLKTVFLSSPPIPAVNATSRGEGVGKPSPCMLLAGAPPWEWGDQGYRQPQWLLGEAARAGGCGAVWQAHTVCTYNKPFGFDSLRWFVRVSETELEGGLVWGRSCEGSLLHSTYT